jgi:hypothetical protein
VTIAWSVNSQMSPSPAYFNDSIAWGPTLQYGANSGVFSSKTPSYALTGIPSNTIYYFAASAALACPILPSGGINLYHAQVTGCFYINGNGGGDLCPFGRLGVSGVHVNPNAQGTSATFSWTTTPTTLVPTGNVVTSTLWVNDNTWVTGSPKTVNGLSSSTTYQFYINASAPGYNSTSYYFAFNTACTPAVISGTVSIAGAQGLPPIYGAQVQIGSAVVTSNASGGYFYAYPDCQSHSYSAKAYAVGYYPDGPGTGNVQPNHTAIVNFPLQIWSTWDVEHQFFNYSSGPLPTPSYLSSTNVSAYSGSILAGLTGSSFPSKPPSGDTSVLEITGNASHQSSQLIYSLGGPPDPLVTNGPATIGLGAPLWLAFSMFVPSPGHSTYSSVSGHFGVDAYMSNNESLDSEQGWNIGTDSTVPGVGQQVFSSQGDNCWAADITIPYDVWTNVYCDLTGLEKVSISSFWLVYHDDSGVVGQVTAFFDSIRLVEPLEQQTIVNGGFETGGDVPYAWMESGYVSVVHGVTGEDGNHSLRVGSPTAIQPGCGDACQTYVSAAWQVIRVPDANLTSGLELSILVDPAWTCTRNCNSTYEIRTWDYTTDSAGPLLYSSNWSQGWQSWSSLLNPYLGHVLAIYLEVSESGAYPAYVYFDDAQLLSSGERLSEGGNYAAGTVYGKLTLPGSTYRPSCGGSDTVWFIPQSFSAANHAWQTYYINPNFYTVDGNVSLTANVLNYTNQCRTGSYDQLLLQVTGSANSTAHAAGFQYFSIFDSCLWVTLNQSGATVPAPTFKPLRLLNLTGGESSITPPPRDWWLDALAIGFEISVEVAAAVVTDGAALPLLFEVSYDTIGHVPLVLALLNLLFGGSTATTACMNPPKGAVSSYWTGNWNTQGFGPSTVIALGQLAVDVGKTGSGSGGGTYNISMEWTTDYCQDAGNQTCAIGYISGTTTFVTISTSYVLTVVTT